MNKVAYAGQRKSRRRSSLLVAAAAAAAEEEGAYGRGASSPSQTLKAFACLQSGETTKILDLLHALPSLQQEPDHIGGCIALLRLVRHNPTKVMKLGRVQRMLQARAVLSSDLKAAKILEQGLTLITLPCGAELQAASFETDDFYGTSQQGDVVVIERWGAVDPEMLQECSVEFFKSWVAWRHEARAMVADVLSWRAKRVVRFALVLDLHGVTLAHRKLMPYVREFASGDAISAVPPMRSCSYFVRAGGVATGIFKFFADHKTWKNRFLVSGADPFTSSPDFAALFDPSAIPADIGGGTGVTRRGSLFCRDVEPPALSDAAALWSMYNGLLSPSLRAQMTAGVRKSLMESVDLVATDFSTLREEKLAQHFQGTRAWIERRVEAWLADPAGARVFCLVGGAGTGKSVVASLVLRRLLAEQRGAAHHYCRHDDAASSSPAAICESLAAMLSASIPGFAAAIHHAKTEVAAALDGGTAAELFDQLLRRPLSQVSLPANVPLVVVIDALDELAGEGRALVLSLLTSSGLGGALPPWLRVFVTSREDRQVQRKLKNDCELMELRVDDPRNQEDVRAYVRSVARRHVKTGINTDALERQVFGKFGVDLQGSLRALEQPMLLSKSAYDTVVKELAKEAAFAALAAVEERRQKVRQTESDFGPLYAQARVAQGVLTSCIADAWEVLGVVAVSGPTLRHPVPGRAQDWVHEALDPGIKGKERAYEKVANDYAGDASKMKDLSRITLEFADCAGLLAGVNTLLAQFKVVTLKNKFASPTPMGKSSASSSKNNAKARCFRLSTLMNQLNSLGLSLSGGVIIIL